MPHSDFWIAVIFLCKLSLMLSNFQYRLLKRLKKIFLPGYAIYSANRIIRFRQINNRRWCKSITAKQWLSGWSNWWRCLPEEALSWSWFFKEGQEWKHKKTWVCFQQVCWKWGYFNSCCHQSVWRNKKRAFIVWSACKNGMDQLHRISLEYSAIWRYRGVIEFLLSDNILYYIHSQLCLY